MWKIYNINSTLCKAALAERVPAGEEEVMSQCMQKIVMSGATLRDFHGMIVNYSVVFIELG